MLVVAQCNLVCSESRYGLASRALPYRITYPPLPLLLLMMSRVLHWLHYRRRPNARGAQRRWSDMIDLPNDGIIRRFSKHLTFLDESDFANTQIRIPVNDDGIMGYDLKMDNVCYGFVFNIILVLSIIVSIFFSLLSFILSFDSCHSFCSLFIVLKYCRDFISA